MLDKQDLLKSLRLNRDDYSICEYITTEELDYLILLLELDIIREQEKLKEKR